MIQEQEKQSQAVQEVMVPVGQLQGNPWNRKTFDSQGLKELSDNIKANGILEPLVVRKVADGKYEIASGERRWRASLQAGLQQVPCRILELSDDNVQEMNIVTNVQREDIPALERAAMVKGLLKPGMTQAQLAAKLNKSQQWVTDLLGFLDLPDEVHQHIEGMSLGVNQLRAISSLPTPEYQAQLAQEVKEGKVPLEHIEQRARHLHSGFKSMQAKRAKKAAVVAASSSPSSFPAGVSGEPINGSPITTSGMTSKAKSSTVAANAAPLSVSTVATAMKDTLADQYLGNFGRLAGPLRQGLDAAWKAPKKKLFGWGIFFLVISWFWHPVQQTLNYALRRVMHVEVNDALNKNTIPNISQAVSSQSQSGGEQMQTLASLAKMAAPAGLKGDLVSNQTVHLTWQPVPGAFGYNVYSSYESNDFTKETSKPVRDPEGWWKWASPARYRLVVTAVDAEDHESVYSQPLKLDLR